MTYPELRALMFAYHTEALSRVAMEAAIHLWQRSNGFKPVEWKYPKPDITILKRGILYRMNPSLKFVFDSTYWREKKGCSGGK